MCLMCLMCLMRLIKPVLIQHPVRETFLEKELGWPRFILICSPGFSNVFACRSFHNVFSTFPGFFHDFPKELLGTAWFRAGAATCVAGHDGLRQLLCSLPGRPGHRCNADATQMQRRCNADATPTTSLATSLATCCTKTTYNIYIYTVSMLVNTCCTLSCCVNMSAWCRFFKEMATDRKSCKTLLWHCTRIFYLNIWGLKFFVDDGQCFLSNARRLWLNDNRGLWFVQRLHAGGDLPAVDGGCTWQTEPLQNAHRHGNTMHGIGHEKQAKQGRFFSMRKIWSFTLHPV